MMLGRSSQGASSTLMSKRCSISTRRCSAASSRASRSLRFPARIGLQDQSDIGASRDNVRFGSKADIRAVAEMERPPRGGLSEICSDEKRSLELHRRRISLACLRKPSATCVRFCFVEASGDDRARAKASYAIPKSSTVMESVLFGGSVVVATFKPSFARQFAEQSLRHLLGRTTG